MNKPHYKNRYCVICKRPFKCSLFSRRKTCCHKCAVKHDRAFQAEYRKKPEAIAICKAYHIEYYKRKKQEKQ